MKLFSIESTNEDFVTPPVNTVDYNRLAFQINANTTENFSTFTSTIQASLDGVNYVDIETSTIVFNEVQNHIIEIPDPCSTWYRVSFEFVGQAEGESVDVEVFAEFRRV
jgi:hypothetical protein